MGRQRGRSRSHDDHGQHIFDVEAPEVGEVRWNMSGSQNFMAKVMAVFMDMDKMIGKDFEAGLADLKRISESPAAAASAAAAK